MVVGLGRLINTFQQVVCVEEMKENCVVDCLKISSIKQIHIFVILTK